MEKATSREVKHLWVLEDMPRVQELARWYLENILPQIAPGQPQRTRKN